MCSATLRLAYSVLVLEKGIRHNIDGKEIKSDRDAYL